MKNSMSGHIKNFILKNKAFSVFLLLQLFILFFLFVRLWGKGLEIQFSAANLNITDEKVVVNEDDSIYITGKNDSEVFGRWIAETEPFNLRGGMYEIAVDYQSLLNDTDEEADCENTTGRLETIREEKADNFYYNYLTFQDGDTNRTTRIWVRDDSGENELKLVINFYGTGELKMNRIIIKELRIWRYMRFFTWLICFCAIDMLYLYFFVNENVKKKLVTSILLFTMFFASLPMFTDLLFSGDDLNFHLTRILTLADSLSAGNILEPIQTEVCNGYGYAAPLFYGQLFLYLPAILYNLAVPIQTCYQIYMITVNIVTCLIAYFSFKGIAKDDKIAATGAVVYTLSIYRLTNLFVRAAVGEYTAMAFFPLLVYGFVHIYTKKENKIKFRDSLSIVIGLSGIIQSHVISCELAAIFIILICIFNFRKTFMVKRFIVLLEAAFFTLLVNIGFLVPLIDSMGMDIQIKSNAINNMQRHGTYLVQVLGLLPISFGKSGGGMQDEAHLSLGLTLLAGLIVFFICCVMRKEWGVKKSPVYRVGIINAILSVICIVLTLKFFPWNSIEGVQESVARMFCTVQFPWRYLAPATIFATVAVIAGLVIIKNVKGEKTAYFLCMALGLTAIVTSGLFMGVYTNAAVTSNAIGYADIIFDTGVNEYLLKDTQIEELHQRKVSYDENFITISNYQYEDGITTFACRNTADVEKPVEIPLLNYDNYHAYDIVTGKEIGIMNGSNNRVSLAVPAFFDSEVKVVYEIPAVWKASYAVSVVSMIFLVVAVVRNRREERLC